MLEQLRQKHKVCILSSENIARIYWEYDLSLRKPKRIE